MQSTIQVHKKFSDLDSTLLKEEAERLYSKLKTLNYSIQECMIFAPYTYTINKLKKEKNAVILAHNYQRPEILFGIADITGDSLALSKEAAKTTADIILFCGVHFMAETAKILNPTKKVLLPDMKAGCSLAESITREDVRKLKAQYPGVPVVTYVNTSAEVKAESDVMCTSANALQIVNALPGNKVIFLPDELMGKNIAAQTDKEVIIWNGRCIVHEQFTPEQIEVYREVYPGLKVMSHLECSPEVVNLSDKAGSTSDMIKYVKNTNAESYMLITECGLSDMLRAEFPEKKFIAPCTICPYMKKNHLQNTLEVLQNETNEITVPEETLLKATKALDRMFELMEKG